MMDLPWAQFGVAVVMLSVFVFFHFRGMKSGERREAQMRTDGIKHREECQKEIADHRKECRADTAGLVARIRDLEERQFKDAIGMAKMCGDALKMHAETQRRWIEIGVETARHTALDPKGKT